MSNRNAFHQLLPALAYSRVLYIIDSAHRGHKIFTLRGRRPTASIRLSPTLQVLHVLVVLLIQALHVFEYDHLAVSKRGSSIVKGGLVWRVQNTTSVPLLMWGGVRCRRGQEILGLARRAGISCSGHSCPANGY